MYVKITYGCLMFISNLGILSIFCSLRYLRYRPNHWNIFSLERDFNFTDSKMDCIGCNWFRNIQYIPRNMHTVFALLCFVVVIHWLIFPYPSGLLHWHCGNLTIAPVPAKQPWWIWTNTSCEFIMNDCTTTTKQSTTNHVHISWDILYGPVTLSFITLRSASLKAVLIVVNLLRP